MLNIPNRVLCVCAGNICRSPLMQGIFEATVKQLGKEKEFYFDSAGCHDYHHGEPPDKRAIKIAAKNGIDISNQRARIISPDDFNFFNYILAADTDNLDYLNRINNRSKATVKLLLDYYKDSQESQVPDPYYGGEKEFNYAFFLIQHGVHGFLESVKS